MKWIQRLRLQKGALRRTVPQRERTRSGTIKVSYLRRLARGKGRMAARARLALRLRAYARRRKKG